MQQHSMNQLTCDKYLSLTQDTEKFSYFLVNQDNSVF